MLSSWSFLSTPDRGNKKKTTTKRMTHDMIHDHGEKPITIENCVIEHSQTHQLFIKLRQGKSQPGKRFGYPVLISIDFDEFRSPFIAYCFV